MHHFKISWLISAFSALAACGPLRRTGERPLAQALIAEDSAMFVFPAESLAVLTWNPRTPGTNPVGVDWTWVVQWEPAAPGTDSVVMLAVNRRHHASEPIRHGTLAQLLAETSAEEGVPCWRCREPAVRFAPLSGVVAYARGQQAVVVIRGRALVRHLFWSHPAEVYLEKTGTLSDGVRLPVRYR